MSLIYAENFGLFVRCHWKHEETKKKQKQKFFKKNKTRRHRFPTEKNRKKHAAISQKKKTWKISDCFSSLCLYC